jgi:hypothetical protein
MAGSIYGWARQTYLYSLFQDCTATMTNRPGATWGLGAIYLRGTRFRFGASAPGGARVIRPNPVDSGCGPDDAIKFSGDINTVATSALLDFSHIGAAAGIDASTARSAAPTRTARRNPTRSCSSE